jgi:two-component system, NtrC family, sensor kinase
LVDPSYFGDYWQRTGAADVEDDGFRIGIARADGALLARQPEPPFGDTWRIPDAYLTRLWTANDRGYQRIEETGGERLVAYRRLASLPLYVFASLPSSAITASWLHLMGTYLLLGVPATLALFGIALVALRRAHAAEAAAALAAVESHKRQIAEEAVRQSQKLEALGKLTGGIAHDFNNLLSVIIGNAELLRTRPADRLERSIGQIMQAARRGGELTQRLLSFSRRRVLNPRMIDLAEELPRLCELLKTSLRGDIRLRCQLAEQLWPIEVDPGELEAALVNVALNARDAMPTGGRFELTARNVHIFAGELPGTPDIGGDFVAIALQDTGSGMPQEVAARAFEPFFTTKDVGRGTGLGLSQVYGFVQQSGGAIALESAPDKGTSVRIHLPRAARHVMEAAAEPADQPVAAAGTPHSVLLVEDNPEVADITCEMLRSLGNRVETVNRAQAALDRLTTDRRFVDIVVSDIVMPDGMNGLQLAREIRNRHPTLPVVLVSGYSDSLAEAEKEFPVLAKPLSQAALAEAINRRFVDLPPPRVVVDNTQRH